MTLSVEPADGLPDWAREIAKERFPGLVGPSARSVVWKGGPDTFVAFDGGRLLAVVSRPKPEDPVHLA